MKKDDFILTKIGNELMEEAKKKKKKKENKCTDNHSYPGFGPVFRPLYTEEELAGTADSESDGEDSGDAGSGDGSAGGE
jgi:hypothetical protein